jgi:hypothetical protein
LFNEAVHKIWCPRKRRLSAGEREDQTAIQKEAKWWVTMLKPLCNVEIPAVRNGPEGYLIRQSRQAFELRLWLFQQLLIA